jgi:hypothetical protein
MKHRQLISAVLAAVILTNACSGAGNNDSADDDGPAVDSAQPIESTTTTTIAAGETTTSVANADDEVAVEDESSVPVRRQLDWVVALLNDGGEATVDQVDERFSPTFLAQFPAEQIVGFLPQVFAVATPPYTVEQFEAGADGLTADALLVGTDDGRLAVQIAVSANPPNLIEGLGITPAEVEFPLPITVEAIDDRLTELGAQSSLGLYDVTDGSCTAVHEIRTDETIVLGSVFKLWILAALANEIDQGRASWSETLMVTDELRSNPDGDVYQLGTGAELTLQELAEAMISISDNTATDLLLDRLGRPTVEEAMERAGVSDPIANVPMLSTGNLFALKFVPDPPNAADYRLLDEAERRALLDELDQATFAWVGVATELTDLADITNAEGVPIDQPRDLDIEWFATAEDLCRTHVHLDELANIPGLEEVAAILEVNPGTGLPFDRDRWPTIRFKGGSEPGVVAGAWWFEGPEGDRFVVAGGVSNPSAPLDELNAVLTVASAIELIE